MSAYSLAVPVQTPPYTTAQSLIKAQQSAAPQLITQPYLAVAKTIALAFSLLQAVAVAVAVASLIALVQ